MKYVTQFCPASCHFLLALRDQVRQHPHKTKGKITATYILISINLRHTKLEWKQILSYLNLILTCLSRRLWSVTANILSLRPKSFITIVTHSDDRTYNNFRTKPFFDNEPWFSVLPTIFTFFYISRIYEFLGFRSSLDAISVPVGQGWRTSGTRNSLLSQICNPFPRQSSPDCTICVIIHTYLTA
jgi:hypothetical protein